MRIRVQCSAKEKQILASSIVVVPIQAVAGYPDRLQDRNARYECTSGGVGDAFLERKMEG